MWIFACFAFANEQSLVKLKLPQEVISGRSFHIHAWADDDVFEQLRLRIRIKGEIDFHKVAFTKQENQYIADVPRDIVNTPLLEFYIAGKLKDGRMGLVYASPTDPGTILVVPDVFQLNNSPKPRYHSVLQKGHLKQEMLSSENDWIDHVQVFSANDERAIQEKEQSGRFERLQAQYVFTRTDIKRMGARNLLEIIRVAPNLEISQTMQGDYLVEMRLIRGDARILLVLDDTPLVDPYSGQAFWRISADLIDRVEINYGPQNDKDASSALAGAIRVYSRRQEGLFMDVYRGSPGLYGISAGIGRKTSYFDGHFMINFENQNGYTPSIAMPKIHPEDYSRQSGMLTLGSEYRFSKVQNSRIYARGGMFIEKHNSYLGIFDIPTPTANFERLLWNAEAGIVFPYSVDNIFSIKLYSSQNYIHRDWKFDHIKPPIIGKMGYISLVAGSLIETVVHVSKNNALTLRLDVQMSGVLHDSFYFNSESDSQSKIELDQNQACRILGIRQTSFGICRSTVSLFIQDDWQLLRQLRLTASSNFAMLSDSMFDWKNNFNPKIGVIWAITPKWLTRLGFISSYRAPTFEEKSDTTLQAFRNVIPYYFTGNKLVQPETEKTLEIGADYLQKYDDVTLKVSGSAALSRIDDIIEPISINSDANIIKNTGQDDIVSTEGTVQATFAQGHRLYFNISWSRSFWRGTDENGKLQCDELFAVGGGRENKCSMITNLPQRRADIGGEFKLRGMGFLHINAHFGSERRNNVRTDIEERKQYVIPSYATLNIAFRTVPLWNVFVLYASVFNVFDMPLKDDMRRIDRNFDFVPREGMYAYLGVELKL